jgi:hypothetical protein
MNAPGKLGLFGVLRRFTANLRYPQLFLLFATLFVADLAVPDIIPLADEILLGLLTLLMARLKDRRGDGGGGGRPSGGGDGRHVKDVTPRH